MTEAEWETTDRPDALLEWHFERVAPPPGNRQILMFGLACCERLLPVHPDRAYLHALHLMEKHVEGERFEQSVERATDELMVVEDALDRITTFTMALRLPWFDREAAGIALRRLLLNLMLFRGPEEPQRLCGILRDIFGNPFHLVEIDSRWRSSTVLDLARTIDHERRFERLPILADALMDAGCDSETLLEHCQESLEHVKGCWAIELLLGK